MKSLLVALQFLTRIPVKLRLPPTDHETANSLLYYPLVGCFIGLILFTAQLLLVNVDDMLRSALILTIWVLITGALHLDGLADSADALVGGYGDKEKTLLIMKDPYCGPVGVVVLLLVLLIKFSAIVSLTNESAFLLILAPLMARTSVLLSFLSIPYVRKQGLGSVLVNHFPRNQSFAVLLVTSFLILFSTHWLGMLLIFFLVLVFYLLRHIMIKRIDGMTGDTIGAQIEVIETALLLIGVVGIML